MADQHYLALYRKYRPRTFEDVRGREVIVRTLKSLLRNQGHGQDDDREDFRQGREL